MLLSHRRAFVRVKICGISKRDDVIAAADAGADAIGLNFVGGPRQIDFTTADEILSALQPFVTPVALVRLVNNKAPSELLEWLVDSPVRCLQVYDVRDASALQELSGAG